MLLPQKNCPWSLRLSFLPVIFSVYPICFHFSTHFNCNWLSVKFYEGKITSVLLILCPLESIVPKTVKLVSARIWKKEKKLGNERHGWRGGSQRRRGTDMEVERCGRIMGKKKRRDVGKLIIWAKRVYRSQKTSEKYWLLRFFHSLVSLASLLLLFWIRTGVYNLQTQGNGLNTTTFWGQYLCHEVDNDLNRLQHVWF